MANRVKVKQITSGTVPQGYGLVADGSGNTYFEDLGTITDVINAGTIAMEWEFEESTTDTDPGSGKFSRDSDILSNVGFIYYSTETSNKTDVSNILLSIAKGDHIYIQTKDDSTQYEYYIITDIPIDAVDYIKIPVSIVDNSVDIIEKKKTLCGHLLFYTGARGVKSGDTFPISPSNGDIFFRTDLNLTFQYESVRTKWLTVDRQTYTCGRHSLKANTSGYLGVADTTFTSTEGIKMQRNGTIISVSVDNANVITRDIEFRVNNSTTNRIILPLTASKSNFDLTPNIDFSEGDLIQVYSPTSSGNTLDRVIATFEVAWKE